MLSHLQSHTARIISMNYSMIAAHRKSGTDNVIILPSYVSKYPGLAKSAKSYKIMPADTTQFLLVQTPSQRNLLCS